MRFSVKGAKKENPQVVLLKNGKPVTLDPKKILIKVTDDHVEIQFLSPTRDDTDKYELQLTNTGGMASAPFEMEVKGELNFALRHATQQKVCSLI